jgi:hypothetical protein
MKSRRFTCLLICYYLTLQCLLVHADNAILKDETDGNGTIKPVTSDSRSLGHTQNGFEKKIISSGIASPGMIAYEMQRYGQNFEIEENTAEPFKKAASLTCEDDNPYPSGARNLIFGYMCIGAGVIATAITLDEYGINSSRPWVLIPGPTLILTAPVSIIIGRHRLNKHYKWEKQNGHYDYDD